MADVHSILRAMKERQLRLGRIADKHGVKIKTIALDSGIPESTVRSYLQPDKGCDPAMMPISALAQLMGVLPDHWLSILFEPEGKRIACDAEGVDPVATLTALRDHIDAELAKLGSVQT